MPHQRHIANVAGEIDPATGGLWYDTVIIVIGRQNGKTTMIEAKNTWKAFRRPRAQLVYAAQDRGAARIKILDDYEGLRLSQSVATRGLYIARKSNGSEGINWSNGSKLKIVANTDKAGHGLANVDDVTIDEAFSHPGLKVVTALEPTMLVNSDPQIWVASAVGDGTDGLLQHYQEIGVASLTDPDTRVAYFEWSSPGDVDVLDPKVWWSTIPALGYSLTEAAVRRLAHDRTMFARTMLCIRPRGADVQVINPDIWARQRDPGELADLTPPYVVAFATHHERTSASIAVVGRRPAGGLGVVVDRQPGTAWLVDEIRKIKSQRLVTAVWADRRGGDGPTINRLTHRGVYVDEIEPADFATSAGTFVDMLGEPGDQPGELWHAGQTDLDDAVVGARKRTLGESFAWSRLQSEGDVTPLSAATYAVWAHQHHFPNL